jgi:hypothetical protein
VTSSTTIGGRFAVTADIADPDAPQGLLERSLIMRFLVAECVVMPKFYLNVRSGEEVAEDDVGLDLPTLNDARKAALPLLENLDKVRSASQISVEAVVITDERGRELMTVKPNRASPK